MNNLHKQAMLTTTSLKLAAILGIACASQAVMAANPTLKYDSGANYATAKAQFGTTVQGNLSSAYNVMDTANGNSVFSVYCLDPLTFIGNPGSYNTPAAPGNDFSAFTGSAYKALFSTANYTTASVSGTYGLVNTTTAGAVNATVNTNLTNLFNYAYADSLTNGNVLVNGVQTAITAAQKSEALQFAIWEIEGDKAGSYGRTTGGLKYLGTSTDVVSVQIDRLLGALNGTSTWASLGLGTASTYNFTLYTSNAIGTSQSLVRVSKVPEPASLALAGLAVACVFVTRRKSSKV